MKVFLVFMSTQNVCLGRKIRFLYDLDTFIIDEHFKDVTKWPFFRERNLTIQVSFGYMGFYKGRLLNGKNKDRVANCNWYLITAKWKINKKILTFLKKLLFHKWFVQERLSNFLPDQSSSLHQESQNHNDHLLKTYIYKFVEINMKDIRA